MTHKTPGLHDPPPPLTLNLCASDRYTWLRTGCLRAGSLAALSLAWASSSSLSSTIAWSCRGACVCVCVVHITVVEGGIARRAS